MKKISAFVCVNLWLIVFCISISAQDFQKVRDGIEYAKMIKQMKSADGKDENVVFNLLRLDLTKVRLDVVHAMDAAIGLEKTSSIATRHGAIAAINGGFFRLDKSNFAGDAAGVLMINGELLSEPSKNRTAILIRNKSKLTEVKFRQLDFPAGTYKTKKHSFEFTGINRERKENDLIFFDKTFHNSTLTDQNGIEITIQSGKVMSIQHGKGDSIIPQNGFVLSASGDKQEILLKKIKIGTKIRIVKPVVNFCDGENDGAFCFAEDVTNGVPQLIKDGKIDITWQEEKTSKAFVETHHPRTAVAKLKDGKFLMVTVDGRSEESGGISLPDLAAFLLEIGATDAMNLDGGGSTTMFLDGKVVNKPSDSTGERAVGDAILVFPRR